MPQLLLTDIAIRALKPAAERADFWDTKTPGFGVRVGPRAKTFIVKHKNRRHTIGRYPEVSLADARTKAKQVVAAPPAAGSPLTFQQAYDLFLSNHCANVRPRTKSEYEYTLTRHFLGKWKNTKLADITTDKVVSVIMDLTDTPSEAFHAFAVARTFFAWAVSMRYIALSPLYGVKAPRQGPARSRVLGDDELKRVWKAADEIGGSFGTIVKLAILTGQRRGEIAALDHAWIGTETVTLPASITKNKREHEFPMSPATRALLPTEGKGPSSRHGESPISHSMAGRRAKPS
jgi:integrase